MSRDGSGNYALPAGNPVVTATVISSTTFNSTATDIGTALTNSIAKDGQTTPTANLPMGGNRHTAVADGTLRNQYASVGQLQDGSTVLVGAVANVTNAYTGSITPAISTYAVGMIVTMIPSAANTGAATLALNGLSVKAITKFNGVALVANDLLTTVPAELEFISSGAGWLLLNPQVIPGSIIGAGIPDGSLSANVPLLNAANLWAGVHTFTAANPTIVLSSTIPFIRFNVTGQGLDGKRWLLYAAGAGLNLVTSDDADTVNKPILNVGRSANAITSMAFGNATDNPSYSFLGTGLLSAGHSLFSGLVGNSGVGFSGVNTGSGYNVSFNDATAGVLRGFIGVGTTTCGGAAVTDFAIVPGVGGRLIFGTANGTAIGMALSTVGSAALLQTQDQGGTLQDVGWRDLPQNNQSNTNYTTVLADRGKHIWQGSNSAITFTIPANASVAYPTGTALTFINTGSGSTTIAINTDTMVLAGSGATGSRTLAANGMATAVKVNSTLWIISGSGLS